MKKSPEAYILKKGFQNFYSRTNTPDFYVPLQQIKPFEFDGVLFDPYSIGLTCIAALQNSQHKKQEIQVIHEEIGTDTRILSLIAHASPHIQKLLEGTKNKRIKRYVNVLGLHAFLHLNVAKIAAMYKMSHEAPISNMMNAVHLFEKRKSNSKSLRKRLEKPHDSQRILTSKGVISRVIIELKKGVPLSVAIKRFNAHDHRHKIIDYAKELGLIDFNDSPILRNKKLARLLKETETTDYRKKQRILNQLARSKHYEKFYLPPNGPVCKMSEVLDLAEKHKYRNRQQYNIIRKVLKAKGIPIGIGRRTVDQKVRSASGMEHKIKLTQKTYIIDRRDLNDAVDALMRSDLV